MSINDHLISHQGAVFLHETNDSVFTLRLSTKLSWMDRIDTAKRWIEEFSPDWVSLQFVPYAFHSKGLVVGLGKKLRLMAPTTPWHIMFHELWVGIDAYPSMRRRLIGYLQRALLLRMLNYLGPIRTHTHAGLYAHELGEIGTSARHLPLFSNIPVVAGFSPPKPKDSKQWTLVHFGRIRMSLQLSKFAEELGEWQKQSAVTLRVQCVGKTGESESFFRQIFESHGISVMVEGQKSASCVSKILLDADVGLITTPWPLIEKSGALAAIIEHGLPVIVVAEPWPLNKNVIPVRVDRIREYFPGRLAETLRLSHKEDPDVGALDRICSQFVSDLNH